MECRILTSLECNLKCPYCCNKFMRNTFAGVKISEIQNLSMYSAYKVSGGEPTMDMPGLTRVVEILRTMTKKPVYLYTNGYHLLRYLGEIKEMFDGINLGIHPGNSAYWSQESNFSKIVDLPCRLRIHINQAILPKADAEKILKMARQIFPIKHWTMNDCNVMEHRFLIDGTGQSVARNWQPGSAAGRLGSPGSGSEA